MPKPRRSAKPLPVKTAVPFLDAEEAWFWFMRCERVRREGARLAADEALTDRPCEPDDIYRAVMGLFRRRLIGNEHLKVLAEFGWREAPPDPRVREEERPLSLWEDALDRLTTDLKAKGIVSHDGCVAQSG